jgi:hypothetical protein
MASFKSGAMSNNQPQFDQHGLSVSNPNIIRNEESDDYTEDKNDGTEDRMHFHMQGSTSTRPPASAFTSKNNNPFTANQRQNMFSSIDTSSGSDIAK